MNLMTSLGEEDSKMKLRIAKTAYPDKPTNQKEAMMDNTTEETKTILLPSKDQVVTIGLKDGKYTALIKSTKKDYPYELEVPWEKYQTYMRGQQHVQNIFPDMDKSDREFIITGIAGKEWDDLFGSMEEEE